MSTRATARFEIAGWEETTYDEPAEGPTLKRATVRKTFQGDVEGASTTDLLMAQGADGSGLAYTAIERVMGRLGGRAGTFIVQHGASGTDDTVSHGSVVPGSGTGELRGLRGEAAYRHDEQGITFTLDYDLGDESGR